MEKTILPPLNALTIQKFGVTTTKGYRTKKKKKSTVKNKENED
jgi:hypothetical protein